jgi:hypothetical protein
LEWNSRSARLKKTHHSQIIPLSFKRDKFSFFHGNERPAPHCWFLGKIGLLPGREKGFQLTESVDRNENLLKMTRKPFEIQIVIPFFYF